MEIRETKEGTVVVLEPIGRLDTNTSGEFEKKLVELLEEKEERFVIDLTHIDYISSAGLRVLLMAAKRLKNMNGSLVLCSMSAHVKEVFDIAGFTPIFTIVLSQTEAIKISK